MWSSNFRYFIQYSYCIIIITSFWSAFEAFSLSSFFFRLLFHCAAAAGWLLFSEHLLHHFIMADNEKCVLEKYFAEFFDRTRWRGCLGTYTNHFAKWNIFAFIGIHWYSIFEHYDKCNGQRETVWVWAREKKRRQLFIYESGIRNQESFIIIAQEFWYHASYGMRKNFASHMIRSPLQRQKLCASENGAWYFLTPEPEPVLLVWRNCLVHADGHTYTRLNTMWHCAVHIYV